LIFKAYGVGRLRAQLKTYLNQWASEFSGDYEDLISNLKNMTTWWNNLNVRFLTGLRDNYFYDRRRYAKYFLWKYENFLRSQPGSHYPKLTWKDFINIDKNKKVELSIEHIAAQATDELDFAMAVKSGNSNDFKENYLHSLGNLVIDCRSPNASKGKKLFPEKVSKFDEAPFISQHVLIDFVKNYDLNGEPIWDESAITNRQEKIIEDCNNE